MSRLTENAVLLGYDDGQVAWALESGKVGTPSPVKLTQIAQGAATEYDPLEISFTSASTFLSGSDITYSGGRGSAAIRLTGAYSGVDGACSNIHSVLTNTGAHTTGGAGIVGIKSVATNTAALADGNILGAQFIAKHTHATNEMTAQAALIGVEAWSYIADAGQAGTVIGGNFAVHNESTGTAITGSVHRVVQLVCDNAAGANKADESTGLCVWNMAGVWDYGIKFVNSGTSFTTGLYIEGADKAISTTRTRTSQTAENISTDLVFSTDSSHITGTNATWSGSRTSSVLKLTGTHTGTAGGLHGLYSLITASNNYTSDNDAVIGVKSVVLSDGVAVTDGSLYGGQFIAKKSGANDATAQAPFIGLESWFYETGSGEVRTGIGGNFGWHADSTDNAHTAGSVWRGVQIFCDSTGTSNATESTGLCIWNQGGAQDNAISVVHSATGFTNLMYLPDDGVLSKSTQSNAGTQSGWLKVLIGTATRYIKLWDTGPA